MNAWLKWLTPAALAICFTFTGYLPHLAVPAHANPCQADVARLCPDVPPGGGRIMECLRERESEISPACRARVREAVEALKSAAAKRQAACRADAARLCEGIPYGDGRVINCLQENIARLSPACRGALGTEGPCQADIGRLCKGLPPFGPRVTQCLRSHEDALSPDCLAQLERMEVLQEVSTKIVSWHQVCGPDVERFCKEVPPGQGRILQCLMAHEDKISSACRERAEEEFKKIKPVARNWQQACRADLRRLCKGIPPGQGRLLDCLREQADQVSAACRESLP